MTLEDQKTKALELTNEIIADLKNNHHIQFDGRLTHTGRDKVAERTVEPFLRKILALEHDVRTGTARGLIAAERVKRQGHPGKASDPTVVGDETE